jgi:hypothetical protein
VDRVRGGRRRHGGSDLSYQVYGTVAYRIGWASIAAGYRYMSLDYSTENYKLDMSLKGPMIGLTVHF